MKFAHLPLQGAILVKLEPHSDDRGSFTRLFCSDQFERHDLVGHIAQVNQSRTEFRGTLRGMHYQLPPISETKIVKCLRGALLDVIIDLRPDSASYRSHLGIELKASNPAALYVPQGFAHGFMTLEDQTETLYLSSAPYSPSHERGIRYDDPAFNIQWPMAPFHVSDKDKKWPDFDPEYHGVEQFSG